MLVVRGGARTTRALTTWGRARPGARGCDTGKRRGVNVTPHDLDATQPAAHWRRDAHNPERKAVRVLREQCPWQPIER